ncbi:MAG: hypothetical protein RIC19_18380 [Phaeodactylibacter sp.]|uniref:hypothetical protein n=1 Tax=Phaeodactylibacter sp. TaxID=1940289 RepID=UPI0032EDE788
MHEHRLLQLLHSLSRREMTRFREFSESPYHNKHDAVRQLVQYLSAVYPDFTAESCERALLFQRLFPGAPHDQPKLAVIFTYTVHLLEVFLEIETILEQPADRKPLLLGQLRRRQQLKWFEKALVKAERKSEQEEQRNADWYLQRFQLATESDYFFTTVAERRRDSSLQEKQHFLNRYFLAIKLRDACEMAVRERILKVAYHDPMMDVALRQVTDAPDAYQTIPAINIYYRLYLMITKAEKTHYYAVLHHLSEQQEKLPDEELKNIYNYLQNYCIRKINAGEAQFLQEIFQLYQVQLDKALLLEDGQISEWHYKNIVTTALRLNALDWVYQFIEAYRALLPENARENAYRFNLASYHYTAKEYDKVLDLLTQVEYSDLRYSLGAKALLLRTYYDLGEYNTLYSLVDSFRQYLIRNKLMADGRRQGYYNLFKLTRRAAVLRENKGYYNHRRYQREWQRLQKDTHETEAVFNKAWLSERVAELHTDPA